MKNLVIWGVVGALWYWSYKQEKNRHWSQYEVADVTIGGRPFRVATVR